MESLSKEKNLILGLLLGMVIPFNGVEGQLLNMPLPELPENQEILVSEITQIGRAHV